MSKEKILSSLQYFTGWILLVLFGYSFFLPLLIPSLPSSTLIYPILILTFLTHATLGVRSTTRRYKVWRPWLDGVFLGLWGIAAVAFLVSLLS